MPEETGLEAIKRLRREFWEWADKVMGLTPSFFQQLEVDDDWAFLIKWHAVLETCANHLLTAHFKNSQLAPIFARIAMSDPKAGKLAFLAACDLFPKEHGAFIQKLSEMRNHAVHDIKNFGFTFRNFVDQYRKDERNALIRQIGFAYTDEIMVGERKVTSKTVTEENPRRAISVSCRMIIARVFAWEKSQGSTDELARTQALLVS